MYQRQDFGVGGVLISICGHSSFDQSRLSGLWLRAGINSECGEKKQNPLAETSNNNLC